ncbi:MAG: site-specific DNA-methyltransferase [bacterium]
MSNHSNYNMVNYPLPRIDKDEKLRNHLLIFCRLKEGEVWNDPLGKHSIGCIDAIDGEAIQKVLKGNTAALAVHDPPYNMIAFSELELEKFIDWCREWIQVSFENLSKNSSLYVWLGADQSNHFEPFAEFILMMKKTGFDSKSFITMRNQRGYGTQKNWMAVRQELLFYVKGKPSFNMKAEYTDIPKILKGYYKEVGGVKTENLERSKSNTIRAGNVWVDIQQVFHLREENVNGCFAQKPLKSIERIVEASSNAGDLVMDFFAHSGTTLIACERLNRKCFTIDIDPIYCEIAIRRLERFRQTAKLGWQNSNPFADEIMNDTDLKSYLKNEYNVDIIKDPNNNLELEL